MDDLTKRYSIRRDGAGMREDTLGNWVEWFNYANALARIEADAARIRELEALVSEARGILSRLYEPDDVSNEAIVAVTADALALLARMGERNDRS